MKKTKEDTLFQGNILWVTLKLLWKGIAFLGKSLFRGTSYTVTKIKEAKERPTTKQAYQKLDILHTKKGSFDVFEQFLYNNKSTIGLILGARGTGKSALGMALLENFAAETNKKIYAMGFQQAALPSWIKVISTIKEIQNNAVLLVDEGGIEFSSRNTMSDANKLLSEILLIARHKDLSVMFITQNSSNLEINVIRQADYLLLKPSSLLQKDFERKKIKEVYEEAATEFEKHKDVDGVTYIYSDKFTGLIANTLPSFWSERASKGYRKH